MSATMVLIMHKLNMSWVFLSKDVRPIVRAMALKTVLQGSDEDESPQRAGFRV